MQDFIAEHNFRPNVIARSLATLKTYNIAFTIPAEHEAEAVPFFWTCLNAVSETASRQEYDVVAVPFDSRDFAQMRRVVATGKVDGVLLSRNTDHDRALAFLQSCGLPFVLIGHTDQENVVQIDHDHRAACCALTARLLREWPMGRVGLLGSDRSHVVNQNRCRGFQDAVEECGAAPGQVLIRWGADDARLLAAFIDEMLSRGVRSFFCMDDALCVRALNLLRARLPEPDAFRVASFYDSSSLALLHPSLPALHFDAARLGAQACRLLLRQLSGEEVPRRTLLAHQVVIPSRVDAG